MIKVYQTIIDKGYGNCMQAAMASLFELPLEAVPNFKEYGQDWWREMMSFVRQQGYEFDGTLYNYNQYRIINKREGVPTAKGLRNRFHKIKNMKGVHDYFYARVYSPKYYNPEDKPPTTHAVIIDKDFNIVHDVNPNNKGLIVYPESKKLRYNGILNIYMINPVSK
jgi:hypothetical protein